MKFVADMKNLGPKSASWLSAVDICLEDDLISIGPVDAYLLVKARYPEANLNLLWALYGAVNDREWNRISDEEKEDLKEQLRNP